VTATDEATGNLESTGNLECPTPFEIGAENHEIPSEWSSRS
jgi:hypothetical protein